MLTITIPSIELYDDSKHEFITLHEQTLQLEHSLVSLSKWESKWQKAFLTKSDKTNEETLDYIRCMTMTQNVNPVAYNYIPRPIMDQIADYIDNPMTATTFSEEKKGVINKEVITSEVIYYWMVAFNIPFECQKWHLNRLLTLINVCNIKNQPSKKMSRRETLKNNKALNEARKAKHHTNG